MPEPEWMAMKNVDIKVSQGSIQGQLLFMFSVTT